ncbi:MAG: dockerin type I repeat-containing protein [Clostridiales Family XIII bacterium]|jgi:hypothetical protein|nr:dockerin type I repeat-containing protein [Clostridiales Family XIII bacterium]
MTNRRAKILVLVWVVVCALFPVQGFASAPGDGPGGVVAISTAEDLLAIAEDVNAGDDYAGVTVVLQSDIDLGGEAWTPIGTYGYAVAARHPFAGTFDGGGHAIEGLHIAEGDGVALFGYLTGTVKDLTVSGEVSGGQCVGGVIAYLAGTVSGVTNCVTVRAEGSYVGGVAADAAGAFAIADCANEGSLTNFSSDRSSGKLGGILGRADTGMDGVIERCFNTGSITGYQYLGGIVGGQFGEVTVRSCFNTGAIEGHSFGKLYIGGITGKLQGGTIDSCYNRGTVYDNRANQDMGHIRAVGGLVGCEENHTVGTAITNVYQAGLISVNTDGMDPAMDNHYIMMTGHISGGNSSTAANTMTYEDCFYEAGCYPQADPSHPDYVFFRQPDGIAIWDTPYVTEKTAEELKGAEVLAALGAHFAEDAQGINDGYPVLAWQAGGGGQPDVRYPVAEPVVLGGTATAALSAAEAAEGEAVTVTVSGVPAGKRVYLVRVTDAAGTAVAVAAQGAGAYGFVMPGRGVRVEVWLENDVPENAAPHALLLPEGLDAIWTVSVSSGGLLNNNPAPDGGLSVQAGATVFVSVARDAYALAASMDGVLVRGADAAPVPAALLKEGLYAFTMPDADAEVALDISYAPLTVYTQAGDDGAPAAVKTWQRADVLGMAVENVYYSGWSSETDPMIGRADLAVTLDALLADAGLSFAAGDKLRIGSIDGMSMTFAWEDLYGAPRRYYPNIFTESAEGAAPLAPMFVVKGNTALRSDGAGTEPLPGDERNAYRFIYGQTEAELENHTKIVDRLPKYANALTVIQAEAPPDGPAPGDVDGDGVVTISDAVRIVNALIGSATLTEVQFAAADMDGDGTLSMTDVVLLVQRILSLE